jgi:hypothetical protein
MLDDIQVEANRRDVPYQSMLKIWISERLAQIRGPAEAKK